MTEFRMPSLGADMEAGTLVEWLVRPGDVVKRGDIIAVVDTQKGLIDIEVFDEGLIHDLKIKPNEKVPVGTVLALIDQDKTEEKIIKPKPEITEQKVEVAGQEAGSIPAPPTRIKASPLASTFAAENAVDLHNVTGSGEGGAITLQDVEQFLRSAQLAGEIPKEKISAQVRMAVAAAMSKSNREIPHYYLEKKIDLQKALSWLSELNKSKPIQKRILPVVLFLKATALALREVPELNAYWENGLKKQDDIHIGFAISLGGGGVMIPSIHHTDKKTTDEIMTALNDIIPRARAMKLKSSELSSSTVTLTSLGERSAETVFGVIYPPQVALVGFGGIAEQPWAENGMLDVRPVVSVSLAADHRASDGITGAKLLNAIQHYLQQPRLL